MHKAYVLTIAAVCLFANCNDKRVAAQSVRHEEQHTGAPTKIIEIPVNMKEEREIQSAVEKGHQPWRLSAQDVACAALAAYKFDVSLNDCILEKEGKVKAVVSSVKGGSRYRVHLERLVKPEGIWTAKKIEVFGRD